MMDGRTGKMRDVLEQVNTLVRTLDSQKGDIVQAMDSINGLSKTLVAERGTIGAALDAAGPAIKVLRKQHDELVKMLSELDKLGVVGTRVINKIKDDLVAELRHLEPVLRHFADTDKEDSRAAQCPGCGALVPGLVAAAGYPFPMDAGDTIHGDFANVIFKMQFKLTPVSEGGLLPTTLDDLVTLCRSIPTAPICTPAGDAITQLCTLLPSLPLCTNQLAAAAAVGQNGSTKTPTLPNPLKPSPTSGGGSQDPIKKLFGGLLGGGSP
jgi:phospholipid/cholesterol/gamma-HCH transport system substrate-binding protein